MSPSNSSPQGSVKFEEGRKIAKASRDGRQQRTKASKTQQNRCTHEVTEMTGPAQAQAE